MHGHCVYSKWCMGVWGACVRGACGEGYMCEGCKGVQGVHVCVGCVGAC